MSVREELRESLLPVDRYPAPGEAEDVDRLLDAYRAEVLRAAADFVEFWHGQAPDVFSPQDSAHLLRYIADGGDPKSVVYP